MEDAFGTLVFVVAALGAVVAVAALAGTARSYREIGGAGLTHHGDVGLRSLDVETEVQRRIGELT